MKWFSEHLGAEERKTYDTYGKNSVVLSAHPQKSLGIDAARACLAYGICERSTRVPDRKRQTRPDDRGRVRLPSDIRDTPISDVSPCL